MDRVPGVTHYTMEEDGTVVQNVRMSGATGAARPDEEGGGGAGAGRCRNRAAEDDAGEVIGNGYATVIALDPGGTTGWSVMMVHPAALDDPQIKVLDNVTHWCQGQFVGAEWEQVDEMVALAEAWPDAAIVVEDFILRQNRKDRDLLSPVRITSAFEYEMWKVGRLVFRQQPALAKTTCTDSRLKGWGYYVREGGEEHARDATRHALTYLRRASADGRLRYQGWPGLYEKP